MHTRPIAATALLILFLSSMQVVRADDSEGTGPWKKNYKSTTKQVQTGTTTQQVLISSPLSPPYWTTVTVPVYTTVSCCAPATDSDACSVGSNC